MSDQRFRWMNTDSGMAKSSRWSTAASGAVPREAWYCGPRLGKTELTDGFLECIRLELWGERKPRVIAGVDAKLDETLTINGVPMLRITMPGRFVPHFVADETTFYLYKAVVGNVVVDFGLQWGGPVAETHRRAAPMTHMDNVGNVIAFDEAPAPRGVIVAERARAETEAMRTDPVTTEVEMIQDRPPPRIAARLRGDDGSREPTDHHAVRPANPTRVPVADSVLATGDVRAIDSAMSPFGSDNDDDPEPVLAPRQSPAPTEPDEPAEDVAPPVSYGYVAVMSALIGSAVILLLYAAWTFLSLS